jgi:TonB-dependent starch-binding outer membrane protein SusC
MRKALLTTIALIGFLFIFIDPLLAQDRTVTGIVKDQKGVAISNASVVVLGSTIGTLTNDSGFFKISVPENFKSLVFKANDMEQKTVSIFNDNGISVVLLKEDKNLQEVVVVGYGVQKKRTLTGVQAQIKAEDFKNTPIISFEQAIRGRASGVHVTQSSGTPGSSIAVTIRGIGSLSASTQPQYVIDGILANAGDYSRYPVGGEETNALTDINPNEIESIEILKDAAASSIYGARAAKGIILVTTKRGKSGKTNIQFGSYYGLQTVSKKLETLTGPEYVGLMQEMIANRYGAGILPSSKGLVGLDANPSTYGTNNWQNETFRTAVIQNYDLSMSGGNEKTKFFIAGSHLNNKGIVLGSGYDRYNLRVNLDNNINQKLKIGTGIAVTHSSNNRIFNDNSFDAVVTNSIFLGPHIPVYNANGSYGLDSNVQAANPVASALENKLTIKNNRLLLNVFGEYQIIPSLSFKSVVGVDYVAVKEKNFFPSTTTLGLPTNGEGYEAFTQEFNVTSENILTYKTIINDKHDIKVTVANSYQQSQFETISAGATNFPGNDITTLSAGAVKTKASSSGASYGIIGYLARLNYVFMDKYLLTASIRRDASSRFGTNNRWGTFPAISAAWRLSKESFMEPIGFINDLKIRGSWGLSGNASFSNFGSLSLISPGYNYLQNPGVAPTQIGNPDLSWEATEQADVGIDISLLNNRITLVADYFVRNTKDILLSSQIVSTSGFSRVDLNQGTMQNKGYELGINAAVIENKNFKWSSNFNITTIKNSVQSLAGSPPRPVGNASWIEEGYPINSFRGYKVAGIFQTQAEITAAPTQSSATKPGDLRFVDINGDGSITSNDQTILGNANPAFYGGFTNTFTYKSIELTAFLQFVQGNKIYNYGRQFSEGMNNAFGQLATVKDRWTSSKTTGSLPRAVWGDPNNNRRNSDRWIEDGSFARLKNIILAYNFPRAILQRFKLNNFKVYAQAQNLFTLTNYTGLDPEVSTSGITNSRQGVDFNTFPQAKVVSLGVNIGF